MVLDGIISTIVGIIGFALMVGFIASMNTSGMTSMDILVLGFIPTLFLIAILYGSRRCPYIKRLIWCNFPNSVNAKAFMPCQYRAKHESKRFKACVENLQEASLVDEDKFRTYRKLYELHGNTVAAY
jgi:hypothetical protein